MTPYKDTLDEKIERILRFNCPESCDGNGSYIETGADGEPEQGQCQWCFEYGMPAREAINRLIEDAERAYGGCHNCYGKGFSTWRHGETYRGSTHNMRSEIKYCSCDRGKQLQGVVEDAERAALTNELSYMKESLNVMESDYNEQGHSVDWKKMTLAYINDKSTELSQPKEEQE